MRLQRPPSEGTCGSRTSTSVSLRVAAIAEHPDQETSSLSLGKLCCYGDISSLRTLPKMIIVDFELLSRIDGISADNRFAVWGRNSCNDLSSVATKAIHEFFTNPPRLRHALVHSFPYSGMVFYQHNSHMKTFSRVASINTDIFLTQWNVGLAAKRTSPHVPQQIQFRVSTKSLDARELPRF